LYADTGDLVAINALLIAARSFGFSQYKVHYNYIVTNHLRSILSGNRRKLAGHAPLKDSG
jgi:hypothetical protein